MNQLSQQITDRIRDHGQIDRSFIRELMKQVWNPALSAVDPILGEQLTEALSANLDHMDRDGRDLAIEFIRAYQLDTQAGGSSQVHVLAPDLYKQCPNCSGSGQTTCSSCGGMGGRYETRIEYDYENNPIYRDEWVSCFCAGGYVTCGVCGGSGSVHR